MLVAAYVPCSPFVGSCSYSCPLTLIRVVRGALCDCQWGPLESPREAESRPTRFDLSVTTTTNHLRQPFHHHIVGSHLHFNLRASLGTLSSIYFFFSLTAYFLSIGPPPSERSSDSVTPILGFQWKHSLSHPSSLPPPGQSSIHTHTLDIPSIPGPLPLVVAHIILFPPPPP